MEKIFKSFFVADCLMVAFSFIMASYYFVLVLVATPTVTITGLPNWVIFQTSLSPVFHLICSLFWLISLVVWELSALRDYDRMKSNNKNPRVA